MNDKLIISKYKELVDAYKTYSTHVVTMWAKDLNDDEGKELKLNLWHRIKTLESELSLLQEQEDKKEPLSWKTDAESYVKDFASKISTKSLYDDPELAEASNRAVNAMIKEMKPLDQSGIREELPLLIKNILKEGRLLQAIKTYAEWKQCGLKEAKDIVNQYKYLMPKTSRWNG